MRYLLGSVFVSWLGFAATPASAQSIINGDFQASVLAPSTSSYTQSATMTPPETWAIVSFDTIHPSWVDFFDHTLGNASGWYMVINGSTSSLAPAWAQQVTVTPNTPYEFSGWAATALPASPASLEFRVFDGASLVASSAFFSPETAGVWANRTFTFNSGSASSLSLEVWDTNLQFAGNDYAIDDLSVTAVPEPASGLLLASVIAVGALHRMTRRFRRKSESIGAASPETGSQA